MGFPRLPWLALVILGLLWMTRPEFLEMIIRYPREIEFNYALDRDYLERWTGEERSDWLPGTIALSFAENMGFWAS